MSNLRYSKELESLSQQDAEFLVQNYPAGIEAETGMMIMGLEGMALLTIAQDETNNWGSALNVDQVVNEGQYEQIAELIHTLQLCFSISRNSGRGRENTLAKIMPEKLTECIRELLIALGEHKISIETHSLFVDFLSNEFFQMKMEATRNGWGNDPTIKKAFVMMDTVIELLMYPPLQTT